MKEEIMFDNQTKPCRSRVDSKSNPNSLKTKFGSSWGSQIVKGFTADKKTKKTAAIASKKPPLASVENVNQTNQQIPYHSRVKRSLIGDFPCSPAGAQVHPHVFDCHSIRSPASRDLFLELDHLREQLQESKERELALQSELQQCRENSRVSELEKELDSRKNEIDRLAILNTSLEAEKTSLSEQLSALSSMVEHHEENVRLCGHGNRVPSVDGDSAPSSGNLEFEVVELRRLNKELQFQKRNLAIKLSSAESKLSGLEKSAESDIVAKVQAEASLLRHTNANLSKQVEGLQMSRLTEVEELAYLRWINSCLRHELCNSDQAARTMIDIDYNGGVAFNDDDGGEGDARNTEDGSDIKFSIAERIKQWSKNDKSCQASKKEALLDRAWIEAAEARSPTRRHSLGGPKGCAQEFNIVKRRQSDNFIGLPDATDELVSCNKDPAIREKRDLLMDKYDFGRSESSRFVLGKSEVCKSQCLDVEKRALRIPNPPPRPSVSVSNSGPSNGSTVNPPRPPPPPPPPKFSTRSTGVMKRAPQVAELYHSLMRRDSKKDTSSGGICEGANSANVRSSMIGEIENRSSHLQAIKADVETQGEFVKSLIKEVTSAAYKDIEDVVAFVKWLDDELGFLVDERAVLKHFDWPERKADTLREAAFGYQDLKKMETEVSNYKDDPRLPCDIALKKMVTVSEKTERGVYNLLRTRDAMMRQCKEFNIPTDWMLDNNLISKIKFASVKLAKMYMKRVAMELQYMGPLNKDPALEYMLLQAVRFAFRMHQFAGGFDPETMDAFEELRNLVHVRNSTQ
ncbi:protein CHUP1, chloroplastic-like [Phragmites australis]|uniref:protein CHUP1, chloroplastic-like n=1 Tax=Phragmites australis TaxID=29695 RepID=UPI002D7A3EB9|nr:protein CHUP1, chloroplastic-like [Phragmites australis]XP_062194836.1 protein CHUP1, chloroplastic-like [Phragmites australis]XP_062194837.1 protein CHUP1, chloroplastic-like [Phragmites australis]